METKYLELPEGKLAYTNYGGEGQLVLMAPGMGALRSEYRYLAPKLGEAGFRPVTVDLRGQGESSVPWNSYSVPSIGGDMLAMVEALDAKPAHFIGTSKAAAAGVWAAAERPERFLSLTLIGPFVYEVKVNPLMKSMYWVMLKNPWRVQTWIKYYRSLYPTKKPADFENYLNELKENLTQPGRFAAAAAVGNASLAPSAERLGRVKAPALVIMGTKDPDYADPLAVGKYVAEHTNGMLETIEGAGHYPQTEMPDRTIPLIIDFLKRSAV